MPRPKKVGGPEPKKRSRNGCWPCKARKVKCGEEKPSCLNCQRQGETCDYSIRLNWDGRAKKKDDDRPGSQPMSFSDAAIPPPQVSQNTPPPNALNSISPDAIPHISPPAPTSVPYNGQDMASPLVPDHMDRNQPLPPLPSFQGRQMSNVPMLDSFQAPQNMDNLSRQAMWQNGNGSMQGQNLGGLNITSGSVAMPQLAQFRQFQQMEYPSPAESGLGSPTPNGPTSVMNNSIHQTMQMPPPYQSVTSHPPSQNGPQTTAPSPSNHAKRVRLSSPHGEHPQLNRHVNRVQRASSYGPGDLDEVQRPSFQPLTPTFFPSHLSNPLTPAASSIASEDFQQRWAPPKPIPTPAVAQAQESNEVRRVSVNSLLSDDPETPPRRPSGESTSNYVPPLNLNTSNYTAPINHGTSNYVPNLTTSISNFSNTSHYSNTSNYSTTPTFSNTPTYSGVMDPTASVFGPTVDLSSPAFLHRRTDSNLTDTYGLDRGHPDLDLPRNNDTAAISGMSPSDTGSDLEGWHGQLGADYHEFGFGLQKKETVFAKGGYYATPVPIRIPKSLEPLPPTLLENPMNLLYFHHFLNHTARILVPHDCPENPFKTILPKIAVEDRNLLHLLLAYSASHRARLLNHPEPANRIALWVRDVFPSLRHALESPGTHISDANLATAIMLASLEIVAPSTFGISVPWQQHLNVARGIILARGGPQSISRRDAVPHFLGRWFTYLDVLGSLSGRKNDQPLFSGDYWPSTENDDPADDNDDYQIDCFSGFTSRCIAILAQIASLAHQCDNERIDVDGEVRPGWRPSEDIILRAEQLRADLNTARTHVHKPCPHRSESDTEAGWDGLEMVATNEAFHWAGLVHLNRRVLGKERTDPEVQNAVREIVGALYKVRKGGSAEACLLFPMFTAGVEATEERVRARILERVKGVEEFGMTQVHKARTLMERAWRTGKPWETLVQGEFFG